jgi:adenylate cyclase
MPTKAPPVLPLPNKPSIAVLPFQNLSGDPEQEYFADGIVEDITTALSKIRWFFVIARNSAFAYKGPAVDISPHSPDETAISGTFGTVFDYYSASYR